MSTEQFYRFLYLVVWPFFNLFHPVRTVGREHIPEGAAVICPNHTALSDPFFVAFAFQKKNPLRPMAKIELIAGARDRLAAGQGWASSDVDRGHADMSRRPRSALALPEGRGHKLLIFPEGTRVEEGEDVDGQGGRGPVCHPDGGAPSCRCTSPGAEALVPAYHGGVRRALTIPRSQGRRATAEENGGDRPCRSCGADPRIWGRACPVKIRIWPNSAGFCYGVTPGGGAGGVGRPVRRALCDAGSHHPQPAT